ncbi:hypothetical protein VFPFJ_02284 [Purpureocillium lilacinum]|uniref:Uncharacterized protein n=1 Tax=Purpureocillium lilacinum TaxID=33203 RepID=A0A179HUW7_PURLI|nr:hypothetical protein VFPFJ_02284 [Purpureocillium lilacinum]OAQ93123.1 hypothetical protein VFPFJ_02284 [Purpureocillium lilacinum]
MPLVAPFLPVDSTAGSRPQPGASEHLLLASPFLTHVMHRAAHCTLRCAALRCTAPD